jgi:hypothetical protein
MQSSRRESEQKLAEAEPIVQLLPQPPPVIRFQQSFPEATTFQSKTIKWAEINDNFSYQLAKQQQWRNQEQPETPLQRAVKHPNRIV